MALSNLLILVVASVALVVCGIITGRLLEKEQEIYLDEIRSRREMFRRRQIPRLAILPIAQTKTIKIKNMLGSSEHLSRTHGTRRSSPTLHVE